MRDLPWWATSGSATSRSASAWNSLPATTTPRSWNGRSATRGPSCPAEQRHHGLQLDGEPAGHLGHRHVHEPDRLRPAAAVPIRPLGIDCTMRVTFCPGTTRPAADADCCTSASTTPTAARPTTSALSLPGPSAIRPLDRQSDQHRSIDTPDRRERLAGVRTRKRPWSTGRSRFQSEVYAATRRSHERRQQQFLRHVRLRQLLPHRREPALQPEDGRVRPR